MSFEGGGGSARVSGSAMQGLWENYEPSSYVTQLTPICTQPTILSAFHVPLVFFLSCICHLRIWFCFKKFKCISNHFSIL